MTPQEFIDKLESEGEAYAFTDYGLSENDLDADVSGDFYKAVKDARIAYQRAVAFGHRIYAVSASQ